MLLTDLLHGNTHVAVKTAYRNVFTEDDQGTYSRLVIRNAEGQLRW
ncbi:DUF905 family protein [Escherichia coli]|nr:DUF905 family protein [Escherichia coli]